MIKKYFLLAVSLFVIFVETSQAQELYRPVNAATIVPIDYRNGATGLWISGATGSDCECSYFTSSSAPATFADCTNEATEIATTSGRYYLSLTAGEMNHEFVTVKCHSTSTGAVDYSVTIATIGRTVSDKTGFSLSTPQSFSTTGSVGSITSIPETALPTFKIAH